MNINTAHIEHLPILGICGWSGAGKTTLLLGLLAALRKQGLRIAVVKHDVHGLTVDRPGKDSDRLFQAGADVFMASSAERFVRLHEVEEERFLYHLMGLCREYDLVLVEGHKMSPVPKVWLLSAEENAPPAGVSGIIEVLPRDQERVGRMLTLLQEWLPARWGATPVYGCVLIGGASSRMGRPKHLLQKNGRTWLESNVEKLAAVTAKVVLVGAGDLPPALHTLVRLADIEGAFGPVAGILAALRWQPHVSWLVTACDLPDLQVEALSWLLAAAQAGTWAVLPRLAPGRQPEPLLAWYDFRAQHLLEAQIANHNFRLGAISSQSQVKTPTIPEHLHPSWRNVNSPGDLEGG